jgi:hypothetical protein
MNRANAAPGSAGKSIFAVASGLVVIFVLSLGVDHIFHLLGMYPPYGQPMHDPGDLTLALAYRTVINIFGCWLAARLAPARPMKHALVLGGIGAVLSLAGLAAAVAMNMSPLWYPALLVLESLPCAWLGGRLASRPGHG